MVDNTRNILLLLKSMANKEKDQQKYYLCEILQQFTYLLEREEKKTKEREKTIEQNKILLEEIKSKIEQEIEQEII